MNTVSILISLLAFPISRILLQHYLREPGEVIGDTLASVARKKLEDAMSRRLVERSFEGLGDQVCQRLAPLFADAGSSGISVEAVAREIQATLNVPASARLFIQTGLGDYLHNDLEPARITAELKRARPLPAGHFNQSEIALYDRALDEAVRYVVEVAAKLPAFDAAAVAESLQRLRHMQDTIDKVLDTVQRIERVVVRATDPFSRFEADYRQAVIRNLDYVELFGVDLPEEARHHALSVAYVSLRLASASGEQDDEDDDTQPQPVEEALAGLGPAGGRLLVRGNAGAGKSTLFRWIAIEAAKGAASAGKPRRPPEPQELEATGPRAHEAAEAAWRSRIPFLVRLRDCEKGKLPSPDELPGTVAAEIGRPPEDWVRRVLCGGRGLVLLDGVDEVPHVHHEELRRAVAALTEAYPECSFLVSTRPTAVAPGWLRGQGFAEAEIDEMFSPDIEIFVKRWHAAIGEELRQQGRPATGLEAMAGELLAKLAENPAIARLASNPLLCAMICALHRERSRELPESRASLCDALCQMLLHRRDKESGLRTEAAPDAYRALGLEHKRALVERLAEHMVLNSLSSVAVEAADQQIAGELRQFPPRAGLDPSEVRRGLVDRSGMLSEVRRGHLDFLHNTLKEYLAAERFLDRDAVGLLAKNAVDPAWREVVLFAVATRREKVATEIIRHVLDGGDASETSDNAFQKEPLRSRALLALRCRSMALKLAPEVRDRLDRIAGRLFPPRGLEEAEAFAAAGDAAVPYLQYRTKMPVKQAAACARTLRLIGTRAAKQALSTYGHDDRANVVVEVAQVFPPLSLPIVRRRILDGLGGPVAVKSLVTDIGSLAGRTDVIRLDLSNTRVVDLSPLSTLSSLRMLDLSWIGLASVDELKSLTSVEHLVLAGNKISDLRPLSHLVSLLSLDLTASEVRDLGPLTHLVSLQSLWLPWTKISELSRLAGLSSLRELHVGRTAVKDLVPLSGLKSLQHLWLPDTPVEDIGPLVSLESLHDLDLGGTAVRDLAPLVKLKRLEWLRLDGARMADLSTLAGHPSLKYLWISAIEVEDLSPLLTVKSLTLLYADRALDGNPAVQALRSKGVNVKCE